jgi:hypothetical protein
MENATEVSLQYWPDPQGDSVVIYSARECLVFRGCWAAPGEPADFISCLSFQAVKGIRCFPREASPYVHVPRRLHSGVLSLSDSEMIREHRTHRQRHYPNSVDDRPGLLHYVIEGHDFYHEILAHGFTETAIPAADIHDERFRQLLEEA